MLCECVKGVCACEATPELLLPYTQSISEISLSLLIHGMIEKSFKSVGCWLGAGVALTVILKF